MKNCFIITALVLCALVSNAQTQPATATTDAEQDIQGDVSKTTITVFTDKEFVMQAADAGMKKIRMGNEGSSKAGSERVKNFAAMMVRDHTKANEELKSIVEKNNMTMPVENKEKEMQDMTYKTGPDYDKEYMNRMVMDHHAAIELFEMESKNGKNADLKAFAAKTLPVLKMHLDSAKAVQVSLIK